MSIIQASLVPIEHIGIASNSVWTRSNTHILIEFKHHFNTVMTPSNIVLYTVNVFVVWCFALVDHSHRHFCLLEDDVPLFELIVLIQTTMVDNTLDNVSFFVNIQYIYTYVNIYMYILDFLTYTLCIYKLHVCPGSYPAYWEHILTCVYTYSYIYIYIYICI